MLEYFASDFETVNKTRCLKTALMLLGSIAVSSNIFCWKLSDANFIWKILSWNEQF